MAQITTNALIIATFLFIKISPLTFLFFYKISDCNARKKFTPSPLSSGQRRSGSGDLIFFEISNIDELVKSHIPYVVHASTSSARTEYQ